MTYEQFKEQVLCKKNIFLTGPGGSGKSFMIKKLIIDGDIKSSIDLTSTTGVSAVNIGGRTVHSFSGIGVVHYDSTIEEIVKKVKRSSKGEAVKRIIECSILVIDEVSMLSAFYFETLDKVFQVIRNTEEPFGGIQVIMTGDFLQIPPVNGEFCFNSETWKNLKLHTMYLTQLYRFTDQKYSEMLGRIREAKHTAEDNVELFKRFFAYKNTDLDCLKIQPTYLYSKKVDVSEKNNEELEKNLNVLVKVEANDNYNDKKELDILELLAPKYLYLKKGAQVMLTVNESINDKLCNGSRGVILDCNQNEIEVEFLDGKQIKFPKHAFEHKEGDKLISCRFQFPFILAFALTCHKIQGATLDCAIIDIGHTIFEASQAYVALSRVKSLDGLFIKAYRPSSIFANEDALNFYNSLSSSS
jgi:ATP-dependent DNA helicase PIF1